MITNICGGGTGKQGHKRESREKLAGRERKREREWIRTVLLIKLSESRNHLVAFSNYSIIEGAEFKCVGIDYLM